MAFALLLEPGVEQLCIDNVSTPDSDGGNLPGIGEGIDGVSANADALGSLLNGVSQLGYHEGPPSARSGSFGPGAAQNSLASR